MKQKDKLLGQYKKLHEIMEELNLLTKDIWGNNLQAIHGNTISGVWDLFKEAKEIKKHLLLEIGREEVEENRMRVEVTGSIEWKTASQLEAEERNGK